MVVEAIYQTNVNREFVAVFVAPYENQIRLIFDRIRALIDASPLVKEKVSSSTKNPYAVNFRNGSKIIGFTTGASSGSGGASIRGQRADMIIVDEMDYLGDNDFENITMLAAEREEISIVASSTPTGKRGYFYKICQPDSGYSQHYHPSTHNPNWSDKMEAEFRAEMTELGYIHEILAEFGPQDTGVFNKDKIDQAIHVDNYTYSELTQVQEFTRQRNGYDIPRNISYLANNGIVPKNIFRTMGVDWDKNFHYYMRYIYILCNNIIKKIKRKIMKKINRYKVQQDYFKYINTKTKAYWLGFLMADGCIYKGASKNSFVLQINLKSSDKEILKRFNKSIKSTYPITDYIVKGKNKNYFAVKLKISNTEFCKNLICQGIVPKKSLICKMPNIKKELIPDFIRGYFDGDGCITKTNNKWHFSIIGGENILTSFQSYFNSKGIETRIYKINHSFAYSLETASLKNINNIYNLLYSHSYLFLKRKKEIFINAHKAHLSRLAVM